MNAPLKTPLVESFEKQHEERKISKLRSDHVAPRGLLHAKSRQLTRRASFLQRPVAPERAPKFPFQHEGTIGRQQPHIRQEFSNIIQDPEMNGRNIILIDLKFTFGPRDPLQVFSEDLMTQPICLHAVVLIVDIPEDIAPFFQAHRTIGQSPGR